MANVYSLFGELKGDASHFQNTLRQSDKDLKAFDKNVADSNKRREQYAQQSALLTQRIEAQTQAVREKIAAQNQQLQEKLAAQRVKTETQAETAAQKIAAQSETAKERIAQTTSVARERLAVQLQKVQSDAELRAQRIAQQAESAKERTAAQTAATRERLAQQASQFEIRMATQAANRVEAEQRRMQQSAERSASQSAKAWLAAGGITAGALVAAGVVFGKEGMKMSNSLDRLVRFTSTLDEKFQSPENLKQLRADIESLVPVTGQTAESIARASFTIKSAYSDLNVNELKNFLLETGIAATGSNAQIDSHAEKVIALAKQYGITAQDLRKFNAMIASSFGQALASDSAVAEGFNRVLNAAKSTKQPLDVLIGAMSTLQGVSSDAAGNTTLLDGALAKLNDANYQKGFKSIKADVFDANGEFRSLLDISKDLAKSIEGLNAEQISKKLAFMKDKEAREGFLAMARNYKVFADQVAKGGDLEAYGRKTAVMLSSSEVRWASFWSNIENGQRAFGEKISNGLLASFDQQTIGAKVNVFLHGVAELIVDGFLSLSEIVAKAGAGLGGSVISGLAGLLGFDTGWLDQTNQQMQDDLTKWFADTDTFFDNKSHEFYTKVNQDQVKLFQDILNNPESSAARKESARKSLEALAQGFKDGTKQTNDVIAQSGDQLKGTLAKLADNTQLSAGLREKIKAEMASIGTSAKSGIDQSAAKILDGKKSLQSALTALLNTNISSGLKEKIKQELDSIGKSIADGTKNLSTKDAGAQLADTFFNNYQRNVAAKKPQAFVLQESLLVPNTGAANKSGFSVGQNLWQGLVNGINSGKAQVSAASANLGAIAESGLRNRVETHSPSELFKRIGGDIVAGLVIGIEENSASAETAIGEMVDAVIKRVSKAKSAQRNDALDDVLRDYSNFFKDIAPQTTFLEKLNKLLSDKEVSKVVSENTANLLRQAAGIRDNRKAADDLKESLEKFDSITSGLFGEKSGLEKLNDQFSDPKITAGIAERARQMGMAAASYKAALQILQSTKDDKDGNSFASGILGKREENPNIGVAGPTSSGIESGAMLPPSVYEEPPKLKLAWEDFFGTFRTRITEMQENCLSINKTMGETLVDSVYRLGDVFANSISRWDGTLSGFFESVASGFADMAKQIIAELIRIAAMKAVMSIIGAFAGVPAGGGAAAEASSWMSGGMGKTSGGGGLLGGLLGKLGFASGGFTGAGGKFDPAGVVHRGEFVMDQEATKFWGLGNLSKMLNLQTPSFAGFSSGGFTGGSMPNPAPMSGGDSGKSSPVIQNFHFPNVTDRTKQSEFRQSIKQMMREAAKGIQTAAME